MKSHYMGLFFALASALAGGLHYLFQIWAASQLSDSEFGQLTAWIAYFSVSLALGSFAQYGANFFILSNHRFRQISWGLMILSVLSLSAPFLFPDASGFTIGFSGVVLGILFSWMIGQCQARLAFISMGVGMLFTGLAKFFLAGAAYPVLHPGFQMEWAIALCYAPALVAMSLILVLSLKTSTRVQSPEHAVSSKIFASLFLSFATVFIPQMDIITVDQSQPIEVIGQFAKIALLYKAVFFAFLIFSQWILPFQLRGDVTDSKTMSWFLKRSHSILIVSMSLSLGAIGLSFIIGHFYDPSILKMKGWIILSCLNMMVLTHLFFQLQTDCVCNRLIGPLAICSYFLLSMAGYIYIKPSMDIFLSLNLLLNSLFLVFYKLVFSSKPSLQFDQRQVH